MIVVRAIRPGEYLGGFLATARLFFEESRNDKLTIRLDKFAEIVMAAAMLPNTSVLVAMDGGVCAGYAIINCSNDFTDEMVGDMFQYYVHPDYRGTTTARQLRDAVVAQFDAWKCAVSYVCADTGIDDGQATLLFRNLWAKVGFQLSGLTMSRTR